MVKAGLVRWNQVRSQGLTQLFNHIVLETGVESLVCDSHKLEVTKRVTADGKELYFVLNMSNEERELPNKFADYEDILTGEKAKSSMKKNIGISYTR